MLHFTRSVIEDINWVKRFEHWCYCPNSIEDRWVLLTLDYFVLCVFSCSCYEFNLYHLVSVYACSCLLIPVCRLETLHSCSLCLFQQGPRLPTTRINPLILVRPSSQIQQPFCPLPCCSPLGFGQGHGLRHGLLSTRSSLLSTSITTSVWHLQGQQ